MREPDLVQIGYVLDCPFFINMRRYKMKPSPEAAEELRQRFNYHRPPNDKVVKAHENVRAACFGAATTLVENTPTCPEQTLAIRKLEEAMMWANAAIARNHPAEPRQIPPLVPSKH